MCFCYWLCARSCKNLAPNVTSNAFHMEVLPFLQISKKLQNHFKMWSPGRLITTCLDQLYLAQKGASRDVLAHLSPRNLSVNVLQIYSGVDSFSDWSYRLFNSVLIHYNIDCLWNVRIGFCFCMLTKATADAATCSRESLQPLTQLCWGMNL